MSRAPRRRPSHRLRGDALPERGGNRRAVRRRGARGPRRARGSTARSSWPTTARRTARGTLAAAAGRARRLSLPLAATAPRSRAASPRRAAATSSWATRISRMTSAPSRDFVKALDAGADLVMGSRFRGGIENGAMPPLHRWLGNPVLTGLGRLFFRTDVSDFHCGLRAFRRDALLRPRPADDRDGVRERDGRQGGALRPDESARSPSTLRRDGRSRPPHLRTWRDGWRHLRFLLLYSPRWLFLVPGLALALTGAALIVWLLPGPRVLGRATLDVHTMLAGAAMVLVGARRDLLRGVREDLRHHRRPPAEGPLSRPALRPLGHAGDRPRSRRAWRASSGAAFSWAAS